MCYEPLSPAVLPRCARPPRCGWWKGRRPAPQPTRPPGHATWVLVVESWLPQQFRTRPCRRPALTLHLPCAFAAPLEGSTQGGSRLLPAAGLPRLRALLYACVQRRRPSCSPDSSRRGNRCAAGPSPASGLLVAGFYFVTPTAAARRLIASTAAARRLIAPTAARRLVAPTAARAGYI